MTKIEAVGNKAPLEKKAQKQDWEGITMTKTEAVQEAKYQPKTYPESNVNGLGAKANIPLPAKQAEIKGDRNRLERGFQEAPQSGQVGLRVDSPWKGASYEPIEAQKTEVKRKDAPSPTMEAIRKIPGEISEKAGEVKDKVVNKAAEIKDTVVQRGEQAKDTAYRKGEEIKNEVRQKGAEMKDAAYRKGEEMKYSRETGAEMKDRLKSTTGDLEGRAARKSEELRNQAEFTREQVKAEMPESWKRRDRRFTDSPSEIRRHLESRKDSAVEGIKNVEKKAVDEVKEFGEHLSKTAQDVKEGLGASAHDVKEGAAERWQEFKGKLAEAPKTVVEEGEYIGKVVKEKAAKAGEKIKDTAVTAEQKAKNLIRPAKESVDQGVERAREAKNRATDEFKREANYARDKSAEAWEQGRKEAQAIKNKTARTWEESKDSAGAAVGGVMGKVVQEAEEFGTAVKNTAKDVKEGLSGQHPAPKSERVGVLAGIGEAINRAFETTPDTNRAVASDAGVPVSANLPKGPTNFGDESEVRKALRERVLEEERRSPGFIEGLVRFVFGPSRHPDLGDSKLSDAERTSIQVARINTVAYSPAGTITPDELEEVGVYPTVTTTTTVTTPKDKLTYPVDRKAPDTRVEFDPEAAKMLDRISSIQYSPAIGAPYDYVKEVSAKERETGSLSPRGRARSNSLPSTYTVPESARSSYFQTFRPYMNTNEVEERVLESTIDFFY